MEKNLLKTGKIIFPKKLNLKKKINVGIIGSGKMAKEYIAVIKSFNHKLTYLFSPSRNSNAKLIAKTLKRPENFIKLSNDNELQNLLNIDGIGETQITSLKKFFLNKTNLDVIHNLQKILKIDQTKENNKDGVLNNKIFMFTGKLTGMSRAEAKSLIEKNSGTIVSNVSKKLDYLIIGEKPTKRKVEAAKELKIKILEQSELLHLLNKTS